MQNTTCDFRGSRSADFRSAVLAFAILIILLCSQAFVRADDGRGIPRENLTLIFNHGFNTKKTGHGFGLHSGANAAKEMGGSLNVQSDGPGTGATFILELPLSENAVHHIAPLTEIPAKPSIRPAA